MKDRVAANPNRYAVYDDDHNFLRYEYHERADNPTEEGTPLNKGTLLADETAAMLGLTGDPTVNDGLAIIADRDKTVKATYPVAAGQSITAGDVVDVVNGVVQGSVETLPVGSTIQLNENGSPIDYIVVHQGLPSSMYDDSCNGTWVLRKDILENRQWYGVELSDWENSTLNTYLDGTFLNRFDSKTLGKIKQVKIPYRVGGSGSTVNSGVNGLSCKAFILSAYETGYTTSDNSALPIDGAKLEYFELGAGTEARNKRIGKLNGVASTYWLRSARTNDNSVFRINSTGGLATAISTQSWGVRPIFVLSPGSTSQAIALTTATAGQPCEIIYSGVASVPGITVGQKITSDGVYGVGVLAGVLQVWSKDRPGQMVTGSYVGTGTHGASNQSAIEFPSRPKAVVVSLRSSAYGSSGQYVWIYGTAHGRVNPGVNSDFYCYLTWGENVLQWYASGSSEIQLNTSGEIYDYIAFL